MNLDAERDRLLALADQFAGKFAAPSNEQAFADLGALCRAQSAEIERLRARDSALMSKLGTFKGSGNPELDAALQIPDSAFNAFRDSLPDNYWARYDLSAVRLGWHYATIAAERKGAES